MDLVYLDNNATTQPDPAVVAEMLPYLSEFYGNPSSVHRFGQRSRKAVDEARGLIGALVGAAESELYFTGGGTESINTAVRGIVSARAPRKRVITSTVEHSATRELCQQLTREGMEVVEIGVDGLGRLEEAALVAALSAAPEQVALVTLMWANNETGVLFPIERVAGLCREHKIPFHVDATQVVGKMPVSFKDAGIDAASFASHKFHGPKGVGALYLRRGMRLRPLIIGGPQEKGRRGGTENVPGIVGMGAAAEIAGRHLADMPRVGALRDELEARVLEAVESAMVNGDTGARLPNTTNISFPLLEAEAILLLLSEQNICASAGAACASGSLEPSHVLRAMNIPTAQAHGAVRFSLSRFTTADEVDELLRVLPPIITRLRRVLPVG